jgi:cysteinyl-tRNA synthetase, unknown class
MNYKFLILFAFVTLTSCEKDKTTNNQSDFKQRMREFVIGISQYSKTINPNFLIVPQNGIELVTDNGDATGKPHTAYLDAIDANGQEDLFYGYDNDDQATSTTNNNYLRSFLNISKNAGNTIFVTDYCSTPSKMSDSYTENKKLGYVSFSANQRELNNIPSLIHQENNGIITKLSQVKNFLYLINPSNYSTKNDFIAAVTSTNYDLLIMDLYFSDGNPFTAAEISQLKNKANGGKRMIISYMSIGEAEDYRYYWQSKWSSSKPSWLDKENPNWAGNYKVKYWEKDWQNIIYGNDGSYVKKILDANFDGVYLDIIDAFEFYE